MLSGTPTATATNPPTTLTYTATDTTGSAVQTFSVTVLTEPEFLDATPDDVTYTVNRESTPLTLSAAITAGTTTYELAPLPDGLLFDAVGRRLTGRPTTLGSTDLIYTVTDTNGTGMQTFSVTIIAPTFAATVDDQTYKAGVAISLTLPEAIIGGAAPAYTLTGPNGTDLSELPGLVFDSAATSRVLSGTPTAAGTYALTYTATDVDNNFGTLTFTVVVTAGLTFAFTVTDQPYDAGVAIALLTLPEATPSVSGTLNYTLVGPNGTDLTEVPGLTFAATTRELSGTPTTAGSHRTDPCGHRDNG